MLGGDADAAAERDAAGEEAVGGDGAVVFEVFGSGLPAPTAQFSASDTTGSAPWMVQFTDESSGHATAWLWGFGDGATSTMRHPAHTYASAGTYDVSLTVSGLGQNDTQVKADYIMVAPGVAPDLDQDGDVDGDDVDILTACRTGPMVIPPQPGCEAADFDQDQDVDQLDFSALQKCLSGAGIPADPNCID